MSKDDRAFAAFMVALVVLGAVAFVFNRRAPLFPDPVPSTRNVTCVFDHTKRVQECECAGQEADRGGRIEICLINDARGALRVINETAFDGGVHLSLTNARGEEMSSQPNIETRTGFAVGSIFYEKDGSYLVEFSNPLTQNPTKPNLLGRHFSHFVRISFAPELRMVDLTPTGELMMFDNQEQIEVKYGFVLGKDIAKPEFVMSRLNLRTGDLRQIVDLTDAVRSSGLIKQLEDPYNYYVSLYDGQEGLPFIIHAGPMGIVDLPAYSYVVNVAKGTLTRQVKLQNNVYK